MKHLGIALLILIISAMALQAQQSTGMWTAAVNMPISATATSSGCNAVVTGVTNWCRTGTAELVSINGAAYVQVWPSAATVAGVTSFNGQTGAVTYTPTFPVTSVNGKTGAVSIAATTTLP